MSGASTEINVRRLLFGAVVFLLIWQLASFVVAATAEDPDSVLPGLQTVVKDAKSLSDFWHGGLGVDSPESGGDRTWAGALLALAKASLMTGLRVLAGLTMGVVFGLVLGLAIGLSRIGRRITMAPVNLLAALPVLALVPLYSLWFGATAKAEVILITVTTMITMLRATHHAVEHIPVKWLESARTLGAGTWTVRRRVVFPAILLELRGPLAVTLAVCWTLGLGAELLGVTGGLGEMMNRAIQFTLLSQMVVIAAVLVAMSATSLLLLDRISRRVLRWAAV